MSVLSKAENVAVVVAQMLNVIGDREEITEFVAQMGRDHRTLQQGFTRLCVAWFEHLATLNEGQYDARNEASVELAKKFIAATGDKYDRGLPLI